MSTPAATSAVNHRIPVLRASGSGATSLAAFHAALVAVDLEGYNLVRLSSAIPPGTGVDTTGEAAVPTGHWGDRLYCVYAERRATRVGEQAWAGLGWVQRVDGFGGFFVEHEGTSEDRVAAALEASLADMVARHAGQFAEPDWVVQGTTCTDAPVCSLVIAPYECAPWAGRPPG